MKKFLFYLGILIFFVNCTNEELDYNTHKLNTATYINVGTKNKVGDYAITFTNNKKLRKMSHTSVSGTGYDGFQLFTLCDTGVVMNPYLVEYTTNGWAYAGIGTQDTAWFYSACQEYNFIGIIPSNATSILTESTKSVKVNNVEAFVVKEATEDSPKEFLYTTATVEKGNYGNGVNLNFKHGNAKVYFNFESDDPTAKLLEFNYTPGQPGVPGVPGTKTTTSEKRLMFDLLAEGKLVGYPFNTTQETLGGKYTGQKGNFFNIHPNTYFTNERLAELMPLVNAQFVYTDDCQTDISNVNWEYGEDRQNKVFLKFADGVNAADFIAGNDAFWTNLTATEKSAMQNYYESGCRPIRINQLANGDYFVWGESYGTYMPTTSRYFTILTGGTPGQAEIPASGTKGIILLAATSVAGDGSDALVSNFVASADATVSVGNATVYNEKSLIDRFVYEIPTTALATKTASPSVLFSLPVKSDVEQGFTLKFSYVYKGDSVYDARVYIPSTKCLWKEGKKYTYNIKIQGLSNGKVNPSDADENDPVVSTPNIIEIITVTVDSYTDGDTYDIIVKN